jgi:hypothetical protein
VKPGFSGGLWDAGAADEKVGGAVEADAVEAETDGVTQNDYVILTFRGPL